MEKEAYGQRHRVRVTKATSRSRSIYSWVMALEVGGRLRAAPAGLRRAGDGPAEVAHIGGPAVAVHSGIS